MAPEIVRREAAPSTATDLYSLSVLLFYLLMVGHPLVGRRELEFETWDDHAESVLFGREPMFVFDPDDESNSPLPDLHGSVLTNWTIYPEPIRQLFTQAFTAGLTDPTQRTGARERVALGAARSCAISSCSVQRAARRASGRRGTRTGAAGAAIEGSMIRYDSQIDGWPLVLNRGTVVYRHHLMVDYDFTTVVGRVIAHPNRPDRWGLRNDSPEPWEVVLPNEDLTSAEPGRSVGLLPGTRIQIGRSVATILC